MGDPGFNSSRSTQRDYLGRGWAFPPQWMTPGNDNALAHESDENPFDQPKSMAFFASKTLRTTTNHDRTHADLIEGNADIQEAIRLILGTRLGERVMRPDFGSRLHEFVFAPLTPRTCNLICAEVRKALDRWERRITAIEVTAVPANDEIGRLDVTISYTLETHRIRQNLVYPFYLHQPGQQ